MKGLAFVKDPDGYLIEILPQGPMAAQPVDHAGVAAEGGDGDAAGGVAGGPWSCWGDVRDSFQ